MLQKYVLLPLCFLLSHALLAQVQEDFADGELLNNPAWSGELNFFQVNAALQLQSNGPAANDTLYLSTASSQMDETEWRVRVNYGFAPSTSNQFRIYLVADQQDLEGPLNGYFIGVGETGSDDSYDLFRQDSLSITQIIDGVDGRAGTSADAVLRVLRDAQGNWSLYSDQGATGSFLPEGNTQDLTHSSSAYVGFWVKHSSTRNQSFFFDDLYVGDEIVDTDPPEPLSLSVFSEDELLVQFSENLDPASAANPLHYNLAPLPGTPVSVQPDANDASKVVLSFGGSFVQNTQYTLSISNVADLAGNVMPQTIDLTFTYLIAETPTFKDLVFNEMLPDPTPSQGLPETEFVELYNRSDKALNLANWTFTNGTTNALLPDYFILPGEYIVLCRATDTALFSVPVLGLSSWPALVNSGDELELRSDNGSLIDAVSYQLSWYGDPAKEDGGFSLERISPDPNDCPERANWTASVAALGGTPGSVNSVFDALGDSEAPRLAFVKVLDNRRLQICFDEPMDSLLLSDPAAYALLPDLGSPELIVPLGPDFTCVEIQFADTIQAGQAYTLTIANLADCSGNLLAGPVQVEVLRGRPAYPLSLLISEILADYDPAVGLPEREFVEIYNPTALALDLSGLRLTDGGQSGTLSSGVLEAGGYAILCEASDSALFAPFGRVVGLDNLPSLNNTTDSLYLLSAAGERIDFVFYEASWFRGSEKANGGWSLERIDLSPTGCNDPLNWLPSLDAKGGTPGQPNSVNGTYTDLVLPTITAVRLPAVDRVLLRFSEQMDEAILGMPENYTLSSGVGQAITAIAIAPHFREVTLQFAQGLVENVLYELNISLMMDCSGNASDTLIQLGLPVPAQPGDVLINEILFNPFTGGSDFVEIVNVSANILDLADLRIGEGVTGTDSVFNTDVVASQSIPFLPGEILCLTADVASQRFHYLPPETARFHEMNGFPTYDDAAGDCVLQNAQGDILDRFAYLDDYQFPTLIDDNGVSLERLSLRQPASDPTNWHSAASTVNYATPGYENSQFIPEGTAADVVSLEPQTFSPNDDGQDDVLAIRYAFPFPGANVNIQIFDTQGRLIKLLQPNILLSPEEGTFFWDGTDSKNTKADIGMYVVAVEVLNQQSGVKEMYRKVCVLADRL